MPDGGDIADWDVLLAAGLTLALALACVALFRVPHVALGDCGGRLGGSQPRAALALRAACQASVVCAVLCQKTTQMQHQIDRDMQVRVAAAAAAAALCRHDEGESGLNPSARSYRSRSPGV